MVCPFCNHQNETGRTLCVQCGARLLDLADAAPFIASQPLTEGGPDFEQNGPLNPLSFAVTFRQVLLTPRAIFHHLNPSASLFNALAFMMIGGMVGSLFSGLWQFAGLDWTEFLHWQERGGASPSMSALALWFMTPFLLLMGLFAGSALTHLMLRITGSTGGYGKTIKVFAYAQGATAPFYMLPFLGIFLSLAWSFVIVLKGLKSAHQATSLRVLFAVFAPALLLAGLCLLVLFAAMAMGLLGLFGLASQMGQTPSF